MSDSDSSQEDKYGLHPPAKRPKPAAAGPTSFVTWNANGMISRCTWNKEQLHKLLMETQGPDILCLQEVRLKATSPTNRGTPLASDYKSIKEAMEVTIFANYDKLWSLADTKYAGTLTLVHKRLRFSQQDAAFCTEAAISLLLKKYSLARQDVGLPSKPKNCSPSPKKQQSTMTSFFAPKKNGNKTSAATTSTGEHQEEGRFQFLSFEGFDLINTYVPNNGTKEESFQRRRGWDEQIKTFLSQRKQILNKVQAASRPLLWCGDMNVAKEYKDGTHWERGGKKPSNSDEAGIYEWWKDETQCFVAGAAKKLSPHRPPTDKGIPSFTTNERRRFVEILQEGDLEDVWRTLHPDGVVTEDNGSKYKTQWCRPNWTWRGHLSKDGNAYQSKYQGKGQRLDYFLLSPSSLTSTVVEQCCILGYGERREGHYCGSDHCATILKLKHPLESKGK